MEMVSWCPVGLGTIHGTDVKIGEARWLSLMGKTEAATPVPSAGSPTVLGETPRPQARHDFFTRENGFESDTDPTTDHERSINAVTLAVMEETASCCFLPYVPRSRLRTWSGRAKEVNGDAALPQLEEGAVTPAVMEETARCPDASLLPSEATASATAGMSLAS